MSTKPNRPRIEDLPRLEIVPVRRQDEDVAEPQHEIEQTIHPDFVESVWVWKRPHQVPSGTN